MSVQHISMVLNRREPTKPVSRLVLLTLANYASPEGEAWPSIDTLAQQTSASKRAVQYAIREMERDGLIHIKTGGRTADGKIKRSNLYWIPWDPNNPKGATFAPSWVQSTTSKGATIAPQRVQPTTPEGATTAPDTLKNHQLIQKGHTMAPPPHPIISEEDIYKAYPKHVAKQAALKAIRKVLSHGIDPADLLAHVERYAAAVASWPARDRDFVPYPASWFNSGRYLDDPAEWSRQSSAPDPAQKNFGSSPPAVPFDPLKPNAHTGGVEVLS